MQTYDLESMKAAKSSVLVGEPLRSFVESDSLERRRVLVEPVIPRLRGAIRSRVSGGMHVYVPGNVRGLSAGRKVLRTKNRDAFDKFLTSLLSTAKQTAKFRWLESSGLYVVEATPKELQQIAAFRLTKSVRFPRSVGRVGEGALIGGINKVSPRSRSGRT